MSAFKSLCFSLVVGIFFGNNVAIAQESESAYTLLGKADQYFDQKDYKNAMKFSLQAADKGSASAMSNIGLLYANGFSVKQDYQQAMQWFLKAANKGDAQAMHNIGYLYEKGLGVKQDDQQAALWYQKAKEAKTQ